MRDKFNEQLEQLNVELIRMGALCEEGISAAYENGVLKLTLPKQGEQAPVSRKIAIQ